MTIPSKTISNIQGISDNAARAQTAVPKLVIFPRASNDVNEEAERNPTIFSRVLQFRIDPNPALSGFEQQRK